MFFESKLIYEEGLSYNNLKEKFKQKSPIIVKITRFISTENLIECMISKDVFGYIPLHEFCVNLKALSSVNSNSEFYPQILPKIGKNTLVHILELPRKSNNSNFLLSRKSVLIQNYESLKNSEYLNCEIISIADNALYLDCGYGIEGRCHISEAVVPLILSLKDSGFRIGEILSFKTLSFNDVNCSIDLSYIQSYNFKFKVGDVVLCKIREHLSAEDYDFSTSNSFFVEMLPSHYSGILNLKPGVILKYGDEVLASIYKVKDNGKYKLKLISAN